MRLLLPTMIVAVSMTAVPCGEELLRYVGSIELRRVEGRIDHLAFDAVHQRLFVAALGNNTVEVLDVNSREHLRSLPGFREPQGIAVATEANVIGVADGEGEGIQLLDARDFHRVRSAVLGDDSDNVRYDSDAHLLYVGYGNGAVAVVRPDDGKVLGSVKLNGHPESLQLEHVGSRLYVNVPTADQITVIDRKAMKVVTTCPSAGRRRISPRRWTKRIIESSLAVVDRQRCLSSIRSLDRQPEHPTSSEILTISSTMRRNSGCT